MTIAAALEIALAVGTSVRGDVLRHEFEHFSRDRELLECPHLVQPFDPLAEPVGLRQDADVVLPKRVGRLLVGGPHARGLFGLRVSLSTRLLRPPTP